MAKTHLGQGTTLGYGTVQAGPFTSLANLVTVEYGGQEVASVPTTNLGTTGGMTFRPSSIYDPGDVSFTIQFDQQDTTHVALHTATDTPTVQWWQITYSDGTKDVFQAFTTSFAKSGLEINDSIVTASVDMKISGSVTRTAGSGN